MGCLTRDDILNASDLKTEKIEVPEWGGHVYIRGLTGAERDAFESGMVSMRGRHRDVNLENIRARLVALVTVDEDGKRIFADKDIALLGSKSATALDRVFSAARRLSGLTEEDVNELAEGLENDPFDDSASD